MLGHMIGSDPGSTVVEMFSLNDPVDMKTKLTLSIDKSKVAALRKASARRSKTISALVEELADELEKKDSHEGLEWLNDWSKALNGKYTDQDLDEDPRFAYAMGHKGARKK
jgi:thiamine pyrophosphate-dependent acetolactate synthase large subunit-like protein